MKLNNKGFAISTVMYMILIMAVVLITLTLTLLSNRRLILDKTREETSNNIYNVYNISYREALNILKEEAIEYATLNNIEKESIKISSFSSSIDSKILNEYKLSDRYLTIIANDDTYDIYLGKVNTITASEESLGYLLDIISYKIHGNSIQNGTPTPKRIVEIQSVGDLVTDESNTNFGKYEILMYTNNIFDGLLQEGDYGSGTNRVSSVNYISVKPNTKYIFSRKNERVFFYDENKTQLSRVDTGTNGNTITTPENCKYIRCVWFGTTDTTQTITIKEGVSVYLDDTLNKIENYSDYIDFANKKVVRRIKQIVLDGTEEYQYSVENDSNVFTLNLSQLAIENNTDLKKSICSHYKYSTDISNYSFNINSSGTTISFYDNDYTSVESFKEMIATNYSNGTPVIINYILKEQIEELIDIFDIPTLTEIDSLDVFTTVEPSNIEFIIIQKIKLI